MTNETESNDEVVTCCVCRATDYVRFMERIKGEWLCHVCADYLYADED